MLGRVEVAGGDCRQACLRDPAVEVVPVEELEPVDGGTNVTSYYDWSTAGADWKSIFPIIPESALRATLGILARTAAPGQPRPGA